MSYEQTDTDTATQRRAAEIVRSIDVSAPASLHHSIREMTARKSARRALWTSRPTLRMGASALAAAAVLGVVAILALSTGGPASPTVIQASALALRPATLNAPDESPRSPGQLAISADGIPYPYWNRRFGWRTAGARSDRLGGHTVTTVFYSNPGAGRIGYAIVGGRALPIPGESRAINSRGVHFWVLNSAGATVLTWRRAGHTCILVGSGVSAKTLLTLADWQAT